MQTFLKSGPNFESFLFFALLLHSGLFLLFYARPNLLSSPANIRPHIVEVFQDHRPVVKTLERNENTKAKPKYFAEKRSRVEEETKTSRTGQYQDQAIQRSETNEQDDPEGLGSPKRLSLRELTQLSQSPYRLDDSVREGEQTMVNTDAVYYASFMNRLSEAIYPAWVRHLKDATEILKLEKNPSGITQNSFVTRLGVEMDLDGNIISLQVLKSSGINEIDDAPKSAFWDKEPFRNPPHQMFAANEKTVRFVYEFHFEWKKSFFSIFPSLSL